MNNFPLLKTIPAILSVCLLSASVIAGPVSTPANDFQAHTFGPGHENLSPGDNYAIYQWALQNEGQLQLTGLQNRFESVDPFYASVLELAREEGIRSPAVGPGNYEVVTTDAVPGIDINMRKAWEVYDSSAADKRSVTVTIIDTGIDISHPELKDAIWINEDEIPGDGIDNDGNGYIDDYYGWNFFADTNTVFVGGEDDHGTHAAGTISAARNNEGIAGITSNQYVKIMPVKVLGTQQGIGDAESVIAGIRYAEANGASICNLSFGTYTDYPQLKEVIQNSGMLFIISAGNGDYYGRGYDIDQSPVYPASYNLDNVITVSNLLFDGNLDGTSNFGAACVDIAAPGSYILSCTTNNSYGFMSGTSMSAPMVTGVAAMVYSYRTDLQLSEVKNVILNSAHKTETLSGKNVSGGMLDAYAALTYGL